MFNNALQMAEQYKHLRNEFLTGSLSRYLNDYHIFDGSHLSSAEIQIDRLLEAGKYDDAVRNYCKYDMKKTLQLHSFSNRSNKANIYWNNR